MLYRAETETLEPEREVALSVQDDPEPTLEDYARVVWGGRWVILAAVALGTVTAAAVSVNTPKTYTAQATVMPLGSERGGGLASALSGSLGGALGIENPSDKLLAVFQSRRIAAMVVEDLHLMDLFTQTNGTRLTRDEVIEAVQKGVVKVSGGGRGLITVRAQWRDPAIAAAMANSTIAATGRFLNEHSISMNFQVLDEAVPPLRASSPRIRLNVATAFAVSVFAGLVFVFVREYVRGLRGRRTFNGHHGAESVPNGFRSE
ncbi:MAG: YveK family protein [Nitrospirota bacterium]